MQVRAALAQRAHQNEIKIPNDRTEAIKAIAAGLIYFFIHKPIKTALVVIAMLSGLTYAGMEYLQTKATSDKMSTRLHRFESKFPVQAKELEASSQGESK